ncbi:hypothetical protein HID58_028781 [Brassica napus]|uniref:Uncharacterized protein n=1 Tax=Brassica napus TaxID=3708 RepID=A0ABQ8CD58_BRANA|nr:hypothetical protein HID58_028781 [Brassica napus]
MMGVGGGDGLGGGGDFFGVGGGGDGLGGGGDFFGVGGGDEGLGGGGDFFGDGRGGEGLGSGGAILGVGGDDGVGGFCDGGSWLLNTWKHLRPRIDTRRTPPRPDRLRLETPPEPPHRTFVSPDLITRLELPYSPMVLHRKRHRTNRALIRTTYSSLGSKPETTNSTFRRQEPQPNQPFTANTQASYGYQAGSVEL